MSPNYTNPNYRTLVKLVVGLFALIVLFIVVHLIINFVSTGTLTVTTGSSTAKIIVSSIPIQTGPDRGKIVTTKNGTGSLTIRIKSGSYIVAVQDGSLQTNQSVNLGWLSHKSINLGTTAAAVFEPVLYESVQNVAVDNTRMIYLNNDFNGIEYIDSQNKVTPITGNQYFTSVDWADPNYGIAQDNTGKLYVVNGNTAKPLQSPLSGISNVTGAAYTVTTNRTIYIGFGSNVYRGTDGGGFKQIYSSFSLNDSLVAANDKVMVVNPGRLTESGTATLIGTDGHESKKNFGYPLGGWTPWSQNGKYIVISVGSKPELFDSSLKQIGIIPQPVVINDGAWLDDNTLFYYSAGQLWSYNMSKNESNLVGTVPNQNLIQGISLNSDNSYVYVTVSNSSDTYPRVVYRVGLHGQQVSSDISTLTDLLPINSSTYFIGLRNFSGTPVIDVTSDAGIDPNSSLQSAEETMQGIINLNDVNFEVESGD